MMWGKRREAEVNETANAAAEAPLPPSAAVAETEAAPTPHAQAFAPSAGQPRAAAGDAPLNGAAAPAATAAPGERTQAFWRDKLMPAHFGGAVLLFMRSPARQHYKMANRENVGTLKKVTRQAASSLWYLFMITQLFIMAVLVSNASHAEERHYDLVGPTCRPVDKYVTTITASALIKYYKLQFGDALPFEVQKDGEQTIRVIRLHHIHKNTKRNALIIFPSRRCESGCTGYIYEKKKKCERFYFIIQITLSSSSHIREAKH